MEGADTISSEVCECLQEIQAMGRIAVDVSLKSEKPILEVLGW